MGLASIVKGAGSVITNNPTTAAGLAGAAGLGVMANGQYGVETSIIDDRRAAVTQEFDAATQRLEARIEGAKKLIADWESMSPWQRIVSRFFDFFNSAFGDNEASKGIVERVEEARTLVNGPEDQEGTAAYIQNQIGQERQLALSAIDSNAGRQVMLKTGETVGAIGESAIIALDAATGGADVDGMTLGQGVLAGGAAATAGYYAFRGKLSGISSATQPGIAGRITDPARLLAGPTAPATTTAAKSGGIFSRIGNGLKAGAQAFSKAPGSIWTKGAAAIGAVGLVGAVVTNPSAAEASTLDTSINSATVTDTNVSDLNTTDAAVMAENPADTGLGLVANTGLGLAGGIATHTIVKGAAAAGLTALGVTTGVASGAFVAAAAVSTVAADAIYGAVNWSLGGEFKMPATQWVADKTGLSSMFASPAEGSPVVAEASIGEQRRAARHGSPAPAAG